MKTLLNINIYALLYPTNKLFEMVLYDLRILIHEIHSLDQNTISNLGDSFLRSWIKSWMVTFVNGDFKF